MMRKTIIAVKDNNSTVNRYSLDSYNKDVVMIGRTQDCDIRVDNERVSEHHGCFYKKNNEWCYQDLNSANGSSINGNRISSIVLYNGVKIVLDSVPSIDSSVVDVMIETNFYGGDIYSQNQIGYDNYNEANRGYLRYNSGKTGFNRGYVEHNSPESNNQEVLSKHSQNVWGIVAAVVWTVIGIVGIVNVISSLKILEYIDEMFDESNGSGLMVVLMFICFVATVIGTVMMPIALFIYNKKTMFVSAYMIAIGYIGIVVTVILLFVIELEDQFSELFGSSVFVMCIIAAIIEIVGLITLASCFKKNHNDIKMYNGFSVPIIFFAIAWILVMIMISSSEVYSRFSRANLTIFDYLPLINVWMSIAWTVAVIFSCIYLHIDENPYLSERFSINRYSSSGYGSQFGIQNQDYYQQGQYYGQPRQGYNQYGTYPNNQNNQNGYNNPYGR